jgi:AcrR family transcriptional regulator
MATLAKGARAGYHHGDLRDALIRATDRILAEEGLEGFSLRKAARRAGVSPAAPAHHFGSAAGLLTEVAVLGYEELARRLEVDPSQGAPVDRLKSQAVGYVRFALEYPGRFHLMFRHELLLLDHPQRVEAAEKAWYLLAGTVQAMHGRPVGEPLDEQTRAAVIAAWSTVHGFAHLTLDGKFSKYDPPPSREEILTKILPGVLGALWPQMPL